MRKFKYIEPKNENGDAIEIIVTEKDIENWWDEKAKTFSEAVLKKFENIGGIENYPLEQKILDHISEHWSQEIFDE